METTSTGLQIIKMPPRVQRQLRKRHCKRQESFLWGVPRIIVPELLPIIFGDGLKALSVRPIVTRQSHYIVAIDSSIEVGKAFGMVHDIMDDVKEQLSLHFGYCQCSECTGDKPAEDDPDGVKESSAKFASWPNDPCFEIGCEWWEL